MGRSWGNGVAPKDLVQRVVVLSYIYLLSRRLRARLLSTAKIFVPSRAGCHVFLLRWSRRRKEDEPFTQTFCPHIVVACGARFKVGANHFSFIDFFLVEAQLNRGFSCSGAADMDGALACADGMVRLDSTDVRRSHVKTSTAA